MKAELIAVGTEILTGQIINTNAQFLSEKCAELGIDVYFHTAVGDNENRLLSVLEVASQRSDLVILCGGLGPTEDDLTKQTLATFLGRNLVFDELAMAKLDRFFASRPGRVRTPNNERQAQIVEGSQALQNPAGLAVGGMVEQDGVTYIVLPGPPSELKAMFSESLLPLLSQSQQQLYSRVLRFFGIGESQLVTVLADLIDKQTDPTLAPYAKVGEVTLRLSTKATSQEEADLRLNQLEEDILQRDKLREYFYAYGEENSLVQTVATGLVEKKQTIAIVEQGTGGLLQAELSLALADQPYFSGGKVIGQLGTGLGWLSEDADRIRQELQADLGLAVSVLIKPESTEDNVLAKVYLTLATPSGISQKEIDLGGYSWQYLRQLACLQAWDFVRNTL
ncbi:competence/damage-inducible protein A [Streptococcus suis]|uniref:competence/damage-inducible protein A n=1 Tax=Streptococcus suis TaxID=1307 RepID=UPI00032A4202|nr:competence/damage-inducible protein A [Streptococcus suis]AGL47043.1 Molybdopterin binding motif, CinA N-terminal domain / C-terminal domain of CinA type S [Streptococcus suis TL13]MBY4960541.1 competence/damage-inducible protein A [Streptococcus suis]MBY5027142.1 competence/damage-inducible protein A [Streptococcus suis]MBY6289051.1 competence/damage-inducible protein A [Streptococcus suis]MBY6296101.1 competence/damage-inducible protein A [Streptococcus suis]